nr:MAG TPA: 10 kDa chaperonin [Caudoviricetes sp.]
MLKPLNGNIILKEIPEKKQFKGIIIPKQFAANQIIFAKVIALSEEELHIKNLKIGQYVVLGYSPVWEKKYKHKYNNEEYLIVDEYAILAIVNDNELLELIDVEENV